MPTNPVETIIVRELSPEVKSLFESWSRYLDEVVNYGSTVLAQIGDRDNLGGFEEAPLIMTLRNSLELMDAISILFSKSSIEPCKPILRAVLDSLFTVCYITEKNSINRARDFLICHYYKKLKLYKKMDHNTQQGKQWRNDIKSDRLVGKMKLPIIKELPKYIKNIESIINKAVYNSSVAEYKRIRRKKSNPVWHEFFNGPPKKVELARYLNLLGVYNILYRQFSENSHGMDILDKKVSKGESGAAEITQIRTPHGAQTLCSLSIFLMYDLYKNLIKYYIPKFEKNLVEWYIIEIRDFVNELSSKIILEVK